MSEKEKTTAYLSPMVRGALVLAALALSILAVIPISGPRWRVDFWSDAIYGQPRLWGLFSPAGVLAWWFILIPILLLVVAWALLPWGSEAGPKKRRVYSYGGWLARLLLAWFSISLCIGAVEAYLQIVPHSISRRTAFHLPYQGTHLFPYSAPYVISDPELTTRHRPGATYTAHIRRYSTGDQVQRDFVEPPRLDPIDPYISVTRTISKEGFAGEFGEWPEPGDVDTPMPEVVMLGDSFVMGYYIAGEETVHGRLLHKLAEADWFEQKEAARYNPMDLGIQYAVGGYSPRESLRAFQRYAPEDANPRLMILVIFEGNDITDMYLNDAAVKSGYLPTTMPGKALELIPPSFLESSMIHAFLGKSFILTDTRLPIHKREHARHFSKRSELGDILEKYPDFAAIRPSEYQLAGIAANPIPPRKINVAGEKLNVGISPDELWGLAYGPKWMLRSDGWYDLVSILDQYKFEAERRNSRLIVAFAPTKMRVHQPFFPHEEIKAPEMNNFFRRRGPKMLYDFVEALGSWLEITDWQDEQSKELGMACYRRGIEFIDLCGGLQNEMQRRGALLHWPYDSHWDEAGHDAAAMLLANYILGGEESRELARAGWARLTRNSSGWHRGQLDWWWPEIAPKDDEAE